MLLTVEVDNRSGVEVDEGAAVELACRVLRAEGIEDGELGLAFVGPDEMRELKREHLGIDEATDVLSFPIDGRDELPEGLPRALGDVVLCPQVVGEAWRAPLTHGLLHLLGYDHGEEMERRERELGRMSSALAAASSTRSTTRSRGSSTCSARSGTCGSTSRSRSSCWWSRSATDVTKLELIALLLAIAFVLIAEMINTAIEGAIDVATSSFDPMAKLAKDIAAGAVLIAAINAVAVGYLVFSGKTATKTARLIDRVRDAPAELTIVALVRHRDRRDRDQGVDGQRHAAPRRPAVGPRGDRVRRLDRAHLHRRRRPPLPRLDDRVRARAPRRADPRRVGRPLLARGRCSAACSAR